MKAIMVMFDSLNRCFLPPYGCDWVKDPNFERLYQHTAAFDNCYAGSLPCMPARRELHTGRYNFLHRGWSPLEPFDDSMPELLKKAGVHTHLVSDHTHYWEDGGATYHTRYSTWENVRGQEGDTWKYDLDPEIEGNTALPVTDPHMLAFKKPYWKQDARNRRAIPDAKHSPQQLVFDGGIDFIDTNHGYDNWFLQIEAFDPHEPFFTFEEYLKHYNVPDVGRTIDWPSYDQVHESPEVVEHIRAHYEALVTQCDENLGRVLDKMDEYNLWEDTMLIVNTDHGFLLGEHNWWAKNLMPCFDEIVHTPLFIWDPRTGKKGERREALVQTIDLAPTLLEYFNQPIPKDMQGKALKQTVESDKKVHDYALFGYFGNQMNITDGRYVYMRAARNEEVPLYEYTLMPTRMVGRFGAELQGATLAEPFEFTKGMPTLKVPAKPTDYVTKSYGDQFFDLKNDPNELEPIENETEKARLTEAMKVLMKESEAPSELYERMGL